MRKRKQLVTTQPSGECLHLPTPTMFCNFAPPKIRFTVHFEIFVRSCPSLSIGPWPVEQPAPHCASCYYLHYLRRLRYGIHFVLGLAILVLFRTGFRRVFAASCCPMLWKANVHFYCLWAWRTHGRTDTKTHVSIICKDKYNYTCMNMTLWPLQKLFLWQCATILT